MVDDPRSREQIEQARAAHDLAEQEARERDSESLHDRVFELTDVEQDARIKALESAFDYRGDVTLTFLDGSVLVGYVFDRWVGDEERNGRDARATGSTCSGDSVADASGSLHRLKTCATARLIPVGETCRVVVDFDEVVRLEFSGRDAASGRSWAHWVRKWEQKNGQEVDWFAGDDSSDGADSDS